MAEIDRISIEEHGIPGVDLMERAGRRIAQQMMKRYTQETLQNTLIFCGRGNNGGDGFVIARHLAEHGHAPTIGLLASTGDLRGDAQTNFQRATEYKIPIYSELSAENWPEEVQPKPRQAIVDALLGTGSKGAPREPFAFAIERINRYGKTSPIVSVDIPSGVESDTGNVSGNAVQADVVYTMGLPKIGHVLPPGLDYCRQLEVLDIGFPHELLERAESEAELVSASIIDDWLPVRSHSAHKGSEGHLLIIAGSKGMTGASFLCSQAALRTGAGLVSSVCPKSLLPLYAQAVWEMLTRPVEETDTGAIAENAYEEVLTGRYSYAAAVIGPGMGQHPSTRALIRRVVHELEIPLVIDGDGLNAVDIETLKARKYPWIATPHPGEMARLFGVSSKDIQANRWDYARKLVENSNGVAVLKGPKTVIAAKERVLYINPTGNPAMASGGMGDVLAGCIGALSARGMEPVRAACAGCFLHGLAADLLVSGTGCETLAAGQVAQAIPSAVSFLRELNHTKKEHAIHWI